MLPWRLGWDIRKLRREFTQAQPYPHLVLEKFLLPKVASQAAKDFPKFQATLKDLSLMPPSLADLIESLNSRPLCDLMSRLTGIRELLPDPTLGASDLNLEKKLRLVLFLKENQALLLFAQVSAVPGKRGKLQKVLTLDYFTR